MTEQVTDEAMNDMLNFSLDDVEDVPEFITPPAGVYNIKVTKVETKTVDKMDKDLGRKVPTPLVSINYAVVETIELADANSQAVPAETMFSEGFFLDRPEYFKLFLKNIFGEAALVGKSIGELISQLDGITMKCTINTREHKGNTYASTRDQTLV